MAWATTLEAAALVTVSVRRSTETVYQYANAGANRRYSSRTIATTTVEYRNMTFAAADASAASMGSDTVDGSGNRTIVTAEVVRQNDADAYKITKTTQVTSAWSAWSAWDPPLP